jgi:hypothetical protein
MKNFMKHSIGIMENLISDQNINPINQIVFIISDGRFNKDVIVINIECSCSVHGGEG